MTDQTTNPYVGPRTFEEEDAQFFFGRDREARDLLALVISEPLVLFYAQSGAGKSSIINTKLVPCLRQEGFVILPVSRVGGELPEGIGEVKNVFAYNLLLSMSRGEGVDVNALTQTTISDYLQTRKEKDLANFQPVPIDDDDDDWEDDEEPARVLIIDQFEEILTTHLSRWTERKAFFEQLSDAMRDDPLLWVVLALREDFVAALDPFARLLPNRLRARFHMERMGASAARQAVEQPARQNGRPFAAGVAKTLVDNLRQLRTQDQDEVLIGQYIEPVQLQVVCFQLWQNLKNRPPAPITQEDVNELGNVDAALSQFYEQAIATVLQQTGISELMLRNWFDRQLITEAETRGTVYQGKGETAGLDNRVVQMLANQFLLRAEIRAGGTWYELVHDRFVTPILQANQAWRLNQSPLIRAAEEWDRAGRPRTMLYQSEALEVALDGINRDSLEPIAQKFLTASEDAQSQRDLEKTRGEMEEQRRRAEAEARTALRLRRLTIALVIVFLIAVGAAVLASFEANYARQQENVALANEAEAQNARATAEANEAEAQQQRGVALASEADAQQQREVALASEADAQQQREAAEASAAEAQQQREAAEASEAEAQASEADAQEQRQRAEQLSRESLAQSLGAVAPRLVDRTNNTELAALLSIQAYNINRNNGGELLDSVDDSLRDILAAPYFNVILEDHKGFVLEAAFSHNNELLATADSSGQVLLWDLSKPDAPPAAFIDKHQTVVTALAFSDDDSRLATADASGLILLWNLATRTFVRLEQHTNPVKLLAFTPENELVSSEETVFVYRWPLAAIDEGNEVVPQRILGLNSLHRFVGLSPNGHTLVGANSFHTLSLWDLTTPVTSNISRYYEGNEARIAMVDFSSDMHYMASVNERGIIRIWNLNSTSTIPARIETKVPPRVESGEDGLRGIRISLSSDARQLAVITGNIEDLTVGLWDLSFFLDDGRNAPREGTAIQLGGHTSNLRNVLISEDGLHMATVSDDKTVRLWNLATGAAAPVSLSSQDSAVTAVTLTPDESLLIAGNAAGQLLFWNMIDLANQTRPFRILNGHNGEITELLVVAKDEQPLLISAAYDGLIKIWPLEEIGDTPRFTLDGEGGTVEALALSPDGQTLVSGGEDGLIRFWSLTDILAGGPITYTTLAGHEQWIDELAFSPDSQWLASGGYETVIFLWDWDSIQGAADLAEVTPLRLSGHENYISSLEFSPTGPYLASGSYDNTTRLWNIENLNAPPVVLRGHEDYVFDVSFSPDGNSLATSSWDRTIDVWDVRPLIAGRRTSPTRLTGHTGQVYDMIYSMDGTRLISASGDTTVRVWYAQIDDFAALGCDEVHRNLSWNEWVRYVEGDPYNLTCPNLPVHPSVIDAAVEMARRQEIPRAVALFNRALELGAELDFDPQEKAQAEAAFGRVKNGLRRAELGNIGAALNAFIEAQDLVDIAGSDWQQLCELGYEHNQLDDVLVACETAVTLALESNDSAYNQELCLLSNIPDLHDIMLPACGQMLELLADTESAYDAYQVCLLQYEVEDIADDVASFCELAASQTQTITLGSLSDGYVSVGRGDLWSFRGVAGQRVTIDLTTDVNSPLDTYLVLYGPDGALVAENDDDGESTDSYLEAVTLPETGIYVIVITGFDETSVGAYKIKYQ